MTTCCAPQSSSLPIRTFTTSPSLPRHVLPASKDTFFFGEAFAGFINLDDPTLELLRFGNSKNKGTVSIISFNVTSGGPFEFSRVSYEIEFRNIRSGDAWVVALGNKCGCKTVVATISVA